MYNVSKKLNINAMESWVKNDELPHVAEEHLHSGINSISGQEYYSVFRRLHILVTKIHECLSNLAYIAVKNK